MPFIYSTSHPSFSSQIQYDSQSQYDPQNRYDFQIDSPLPQSHRLFSPYSPNLYRPITIEQQSQRPSQTTPTSTSSRNENLIKSPKSLKRKLTPNLSPLRPSKTINKRKKSNWTDDETRMFLDVYAKWEKKFKDRK